jgi:type II secretion system protein N
MLKKTALVILCIFYAVVLTLVLLVVRFPKDKFLLFATGKVEQELPGVSCTIADVSYIYPLSLGFDAVRLAAPAELLNVSVDNVVITPDPKNPLKKFATSLELYSGRIETDVTYDRESHLVELPKIVATEIDLGTIESLRQRLERNIMGVASFSGQFIGRLGELSEGELTGSLGITQFQLPLRRPILQSESILFDEVVADFSKKGSSVTINKGSASGPAYEGEFTGQVQLVSQLQESRFEIKGDLVPQQAYMEQNRQVARAASLLFKKYNTTKIPYSVSGTLKEPVFRFGEFQ